MKVIVTGAAGQLGHMVVERLLEQLKPDQIGVSVREPAKVQDVASRGVRVCQGDFNDAASLAHAFAGASQVLLVSPSLTGEAAVNATRTAIAAAKKAGASRILYTSHMGSSAQSQFPPMLSHAAAEKTLADSNVPFTSFRNGFYASSAAMMLREALKTGELALPEDGPVAWTSHADLAEGIANVLVKGGFDGNTPNLTAADAIDFAQIASIASEFTGRTIRRTVVADDEFRAAMAARGTPESVIRTMMGMFLASRRSEFSSVGPTLEQILGRKPETMRNFLNKTLSQLRP